VADGAALKAKQHRKRLSDALQLQLERVKEAGRQLDDAVVRGIAVDASRQRIATGGMSAPMPHAKRHRSLAELCTPPPVAGAAAALHSPLSEDDIEGPLGF